MLAKPTPYGLSRRKLERLRQVVRDEGNWPVEVADSILRDLRSGKLCHGEH